MLLATGVITVFIGVGLKATSIQRIGLIFIGVGLVIIAVKVVIAEKRAVEVAGIARRRSNSRKSGLSRRTANVAVGDKNTVDSVALQIDATNSMLQAIQLPDAEDVVLSVDTKPSTQSRFEFHQVNIEKEPHMINPINKKSVIASDADRIGFHDQQPSTSSAII